MSWFEDYLQRRRVKKAYKLITLMIEEHLNSGGSLDDLFLPAVESPVEWDQSLQCWIARASDVEAAFIRVGKQIVLSSGRGGREETATVTERVETSFGGGGVFRLSFDVDSARSEESIG